MKISAITQRIVLSSAILLSVNIANAHNIEESNNADDRYIYVGALFGVSEPAVKSFIDKDTNAKFKLKQSRMFGAYVGYSFYPNMMIELSAEHKPRYGLTYMLPETPLGNGVVIPETPGKTQVSSNIYMASIVYQAEREFIGLKPYVTFGLGLARVRIKPTTTTTDSLARFGFGNNFAFFKIRKSTPNCLAWQAGGGLTRDLSSNISIDFGAKLQVVNDIKVKYDTFNGQSFVPQKPIKKTIGVGEFTLGFTFKIPV